MSYEGAGTPVADGDQWPGRPRLLEEVRKRLRLKHYSLRTEQAYLYWIRRYIRASGRRHPRELDGVAIEAFLSLLATRDHVAASTQNQALSALLFLYREVLGVKLPWMEDVVRAKRPRRLPVVLAKGEVARLLRELAGREWLMASLLYGGRSATTSTRRCCSVRWRPRPGGRASTSRSRRTSSAIPLPRTCWKRGRTSARSRSCSATRTSRRRRSTPTSSIAARAAC